MKKVKKTVLIAVCIIAYLMIIPTVVFCADMSASARFSSTYYGVLAPMYEKLASSDKKVVVIGNSAVAFGVNSALLQSELEASGLDFTVCNFGLYGAIGTKAMLDLAIGEISDGDIIIFTPEINPQSLSLYFSGSEFLRAADSKRSMLFKTAKENRGAIVGNYVSFVAEKLKLDDTGDKGGVYSASSFDENCDMTRAERKSNIMPNGYDSNNPIEVENAFGNEKFVEYVNEWSEKVNKKGATVYYSFAPMNELSVDCGSLDSLYEDAAEKFEFRVISDPKTCAYECEWFYDSNVHLNASGMTMNTLRLSNEIKNELGITSANITPVPEKPPLKMPDEPIEGDNSQADAFVFEENASGVKTVGLTQKGKEAQSLVLPSSYNGQRVTSLEKDVFSGNIRVREITVQENIAVLSDGSFAGCTSLERLVLRHADPEDIRVGYRLLDGAENVKIYVPEASLMAYSTDYYWGYYVGHFKTY